MNYLSLYFDAFPFQSWASNGYHRHRKTKLYPTQSGVAGIICSASGNYINKESKKESIVFLKKINKGKFYSILLHNDNIIIDYQTIGTNYKYDQVYNAQGEKYKGTVVVEKEYLVNAITAVIIEYDDKNFIEEVCSSFKNPKNILSIGRSNCLPCSPIFNSINSTFNEAFISLVNRVNEDNIIVGDDTIIKIVSSSIDGHAVNDVMVGYQEYESRLVKEEDKTLNEWKKQLN